VFHDSQLAWARAGGRYVALACFGVGVGDPRARPADDVMVESWQAREGNDCAQAATNEELLSKLNRTKVFATENRDLYVDGSCEHPACSQVTRAVRACSQLGEHGALLAASQGAMAAGFGQSTVESERMSMLQGVAVAEDEVVIHQDFVAVVGAAARPYKVVVGPRRMFGSYWTDVAIPRGCKR